MKQAVVITSLVLALVCRAGANGEGFDSFGDYMVRTQTKITGSGKVIRVPIKPFKITVTSDGITVRLATSEQSDAWSTFTIYRSDGIGRQSTPGGALEVVPGIQATSDHGGVHKHLRLTRDTLTLTAFPGVSDQTLVTRAIFIPQPPAEEFADDPITESTEP